MKNGLRDCVKYIDDSLSYSYAKAFPGRPALISVLFHGLLIDKNEPYKKPVADPQQEVTVEKFERFIEYFLENGYLFVSPDDLISGLDPNKKYCLITFDDGYYNNTRAVEVLNRLSVPAVFFISTNHILEQKCFWWDVLYRECTSRGVSKAELAQELFHLKQKKNPEIERYLVESFGKNALLPLSDLDRPFTTSELKDFAQNKYVYIGNHTHNHAILTNYDIDGAGDEIVASQEAIDDILGFSPNFISYPNGNVSHEIVALCDKLGFKLGITTKEKQNKLPFNFNNKDQLLLNRFTLWGRENIERQCMKFQSKVQFQTWLKSLKTGIVA